MSDSQARQLNTLAEGLAFPEAPRWHDGELYLSDFYLGRVFKLTPGRAGLDEVCVVPAQPSGLGWDRQGRLHVVSMNDRRLMRLDESGLVEAADLSGLAPGPLNDMLIDTSERTYIGGYGSELEAGEPMTPTKLILVSPDGSVSTVGDDLVFPNGMAVTSDGRTLLVAESFAFRITAFDVASDGNLSSRRTWAEFAPESASPSIESAVASGARIPDGIAIDEQDALWVADAARAGVIRVGEGGAILDFVPTGELAAFAVALGGADGRTLYICAGPPLGHGDPRIERRGALLSCQVDVPANRA